MALIPPFFLDAVVAVGFAGGDGKPIYQATGFIYGHFQKQIDENTKSYFTYLVTNRHVFEGKTEAFVRFNPESGEPAREYKLDLVDASKKPIWLAHQDSAVDVALIGINGQMLRDHGIRFALFASDENVMSRSKALETGLTEGDGVFVLGFPLGLVGEGKNFVVVRHGVIARIRDCLESDQKDFLIDCSIFPGNSGGPVVNRPDAMAIEGTKGIMSTYLVGIVATYLTYHDVAVSQQTGRQRIIFEENSGLASVVPVDYIQEVISNAVARKVEPPPTEVSPDSK
jgi:S1-C subfamily serine protease